MTYSTSTDTTFQGEILYVEEMYHGEGEKSEEEAEVTHEGNILVDPVEDQTPLVPINEDQMLEDTLWEPSRITLIAITSVTGMVEDALGELSRTWPVKTASITEVLVSNLDSQPCVRSHVLAAHSPKDVLSVSLSPFEGSHCFVEYPDLMPTDRACYERLVERLIYLAHTSRDITYAVRVVRQIMHNPDESHMEAIMRLLEYLKSCPERDVLFSKYDDIMEVCGFTNANFSGNITDRRSISDYFTFVGGNCITRSSMEAEYKGMAQSACALLWLKPLLHDLGFKFVTSAELHCDDKVVTDMSQDPMQDDRAMYVGFMKDGHQFIEDKLDFYIIGFLIVLLEEHLEDVLGKKSSRQFLMAHETSWALDDTHAQTLRGELT